MTENWEWKLAVTLRIHAYDITMHLSPLPLPRTGHYFIVPHEKTFSRLLISINVLILIDAVDKIACAKKKVIR